MRLAALSLFSRLIAAIKNEETRRVVDLRTAPHLFASENAVTPETSMNVAAVYGCVRILSESVAMLPFGLFREDGSGARTLEKSHSVHKILSRGPNEYQTAFDFKKQIVQCVALKGNYYAKIERSQFNDKSVISLVPLAPDLVTIDKSDKRGIRYEYRPGGTSEPQVFARKDIFHVRGTRTAADGITGLSVISSAARAIGVALSADKFSEALFRNGVMPSGVLKHPTKLTTEIIERLRTQFAGQYSGSENAFKPIILEEGMGWEQLSINPEEAQFIENKKFGRSDVAMFFGIPPHMLGDVDKTTSWGSGIEQQGIGFVTYTLLPWLQNICECISRDLLTGDKELDLIPVFDTQPLTKADFHTRQQGYKIMYDAKALTPNEWRQREGLNPIQGGDEFPKAPAPNNNFDGSQPEEPTDDAQGDA